jgi:hypothetical protein
MRLSMTALILIGFFSLAFVLVLFGFLCQKIHWNGSQDCFWTGLVIYVVSMCLFFLFIWINSVQYTGDDTGEE